MKDRSFLTLPFFKDSHRQMATTLDRWVVDSLPAHMEGDERVQCRTLVSTLAKGGWCGYSVPAPYGGKLETLDVTTLCILRETLAYHSGLADFAFAMQGLGAGPISLFGTEAQKTHYLPAVASGKKIAAFALSELEAGSDVSAIACEARRDGDFFVINGTKSWISNAGVADFYVVFARTGEAPGTKGLSAVIVDATTPGFWVAEEVEITSPHPVGTIAFTDCRVPASNLLGTPGEGFKIAMATLDIFRSTVGAAALGFARRALDEALGFASKRILFSQPLTSHQMTQDKIAEMASDIDASALMVYRAAWCKDSGRSRITREAAMAKMYATEAAQKVIDHAVQILGGRGVVKDSVVERLYRDIRPLRIYEGTTEIQKIIISAQTLSIYEELSR